MTTDLTHAERRRQYERARRANDPEYAARRRQQERESKRRARARRKVALANP